MGGYFAVTIDVCLNSHDCDKSVSDIVARGWCSCL